LKSADDKDAGYAFGSNPSYELPDHRRFRARQALARQPELGRHQQHVLLDRSLPRHGRRDHDAVLPFADAKALAVYDTFERGAYQLVNAER
jgi:hypothetical protein